MIAVINRFDRTLNQIMVVVGGIRLGIAGIAQLHLQGRINDCPCRKGGNKKGSDSEEISRQLAQKSILEAPGQPGWLGSLINLVKK
jgi:hypothetical protein